jgi:hypothetical protein
MEKQMKKKIFLHIGTHKTGTTSFQQLIRKNAQDLKGQNIYVPPIGKIRSTLGDFQMYSGGLHMISSAFKGETSFDVVDAYLEAFELSGCTSACISSEGFDKLNLYEIQNLYRKFSDYELNILLVLRHPLTLAKSLFCSRGAVGKADNTSFLSSILKNRRILKYSSIINEYSSIGKIKVIKYEDCGNINLELLKSINAVDNSIKGSQSRVRQSLASHVAIANRQIFSALGLSQTTYLKTIYPYLLEFADTQEKTNSIEYFSQSLVSPFPVDKQKQFMREWIEMVFEVDCPVMLEDRWASWRENNFVAEYVKPEIVNQFKEKFFDWLFSEQLSKKNFSI